MIQRVDQSTYDKPNVQGGGQLTNSRSRMQEHLRDAMAVVSDSKVLRYRFEIYMEHDCDRVILSVTETILLLQI